MHTDTEIKEYITHIPELDTEQLVHQYKCALSLQSAQAKKLYKPFLTAAEKELKKRNKPITAIKATPEEDTSHKIADDY
jgi:hypothetical protein